MWPVSSFPLPSPKKSVHANSSPSSYPSRSHPRLIPLLGDTAASHPVPERHRPARLGAARSPCRAALPGFNSRCRRPANRWLLAIGRARSSPEHGDRGGRAGRAGYGAEGRRSHRWPHASCPSRAGQGGRRGQRRAGCNQRHRNGRRRWLILFYEY